MVFKTLENFRKEIDLINREILNLIAKRVALTKTIAHLKKEHNLPLEDLERERVEFDYLKKLGENHNLEPAAIEEIFSLIIEYCKTKMSEVM